MLSDEEVVGAVLQYGTVTEAAVALGVNISTIYRRLKKSSAQAIYHSYQADMLRQTVEELGEARNEALTVIRRIMKNRKVSAAIRLQAAQAILSNDLRYAERLKQTEAGAIDLYIRADAENYVLKKINEQKDSEDKKLKEIKKRGVIHGIS